MKISFSSLMHFTIFFLTLHISACSKPDGVSQLAQVESPPEQVESREATANLSQSPEEMLENIRHKAYSTALENLKLAAERNRDILPVIQSLIEHPNQAYEIFDGCYNYWIDLGYAANSSQEDREFKMALRHYQSIQSQAQYLRSYNIFLEKHFIVMNCWTGPYWEAVAVYLYDESGSTPQVESLILPTFNSETGEITSSKSNIIYGLLGYEEESNLMSLGHKYSGVGNCGFNAKYLLENDDFKLIEFREQIECDEAISASEFPIIYP